MNKQATCAVLPLKSHTSGVAASAWGGAIVVAVLFPSMATAAEAVYPSKTVEVIVPYSAGGGVDAIARAFSREASKETGQQWVVINRPGGGGTIGFAALANAAPDGHTVVFSPASALTNSPFLVKKMPFRNEQIAPVCQVFENVFAIAVKPDSPIKSINDLVAHGKAAPGILSYGHAGPGSVPHLSMTRIENALKIKFNGIGYRGDGQMLPDLMGAHLDFGVPAISSLGGKNFRVLAVLSSKRHPAMPDVPSLTDLGYPVVTPGLNGLYARAGTPALVLQKLERLCKKIVASHDFTEATASLQQVSAFLPRAPFAARLDATYFQNAEMIPELHIAKE